MGLPTISGLAAVFWDGSPGSQNLIRGGATLGDGRIVVPASGAYERFAVGAFADFSNTDIVAAISHRRILELGSTRAGTLRISISSRGLTYHVEQPDDDSEHADNVRFAADLVARRLLRGSSVSFNPVTWAWSRESGTHVLTHTRVQLVELGPVPEGAFTATTVRAGNVAMDRHEAKVTAMRLEADIAEMLSRS